MSISVLVSVIFVTLVFSAFFSGMEIAFITANKFKIELDKKQKSAASGIVKIFTQNQGQFIATMLVGNNIALVIYGMFFAKLIEPSIAKYLTNNNFGILLIQTVISTILILITAEFLPKTVFKQSSNFFLNTFAVPVFIFYILFFPVARFTVFISGFFIKLFFKKNINHQENHSFGHVELSNYLSVVESESKKNEEIENEVKIFKNALDFSKIKVRECYVPRNEIIAVDINEDINNVKDLFIKTKVSKMLVYKKNIDNIVGFIHILDIIKRTKNIKNSLISIPVVPETMPANKLLNKFIQSKTSLALVVDEFGGTSGIISMEDIIEEIFGEIEDEHDTQELIESKISDNEFLLSGRLEIDYLNEKYNLQIPDNANYETVTGFIFNIIEKVPKKGQIIEYENFKFEIIKVEGPKIITVKLFLTEQK